MAKIYQKEIDDGLSGYFEKPLSIAYTLAAAKYSDNSTKVKSINNVIGKLTEDDFLYQYPSILVTAGVWNKNDQVFDKYEVWKARYTPLNKPANLNHEPDKVVAHTSKVFAITDEEDAKLIPDIVDGKPNEDIPNKYHLLTVDNFYKYNIKAYQKANKEHSSRIQALYEKVQSGELCVSMECIFDDFDYAIAYEDGTQKIIQRNDETSFLTKKLKAFGGTGEYQGKKIGILMRNMMFTGKGITDNPANEESVIFPKDCLAFASQNYAKTEDIFKTEKLSAYISNDNGEHKMNLEELKAKVSELEVALKVKSDELAQASKVTSELETLKAELASLTEKFNKVTEENKTIKSELESATKLADETKAKLTTAESEVSALKTEKTKVERIEKIKETLGLSKEDAESNYVVTATLNDEAFVNFLTSTKKLLDNKMAAKATLEQEVAKAKKEADELNKKLAEEQAAKLNKEEPNLGTASTEQTASETRSKALKSVFKKD